MAYFQEMAGPLWKILKLSQLPQIEEDGMGWSVPSASSTKSLKYDTHTLEWSSFLTSAYLKWPTWMLSLG